MNKLATPIFLNNTHRIRVKECWDDGSGGLFLEEQINNFFDENKKNDISIIDIKYSSSITDNNHLSSALIIYMERC